MFVIAFILGVISMFVMFCLGHAAKMEETVNKVRFYVARDTDGALRIYIGKPIRGEHFFISCRQKGGKCIGFDSDLRLYGLNENDYKDLKWEDEPLEVFVNVED